MSYACMNPDSCPRAYVYCVLRMLPVPVRMLAYPAACANSTNRGGLNDHSNP